mgnify:CR=1 FL=1
MALTHAELCERARHWLVNRARCRFAFAEFSCRLPEIPDAIGFRNSECCDALVIECKTSRADFLADRKKPHRQPGCGLGAYRWFMAEPGIIMPTDLPEKWGLLLVKGRTIHVAAGAEPGRTYWPPETDVWRHGDRREYPERIVMFSMLTRLQIGIGAQDFQFHAGASYREKQNAIPAMARDREG